MSIFNMQNRDVLAAVTPTDLDLNFPHMLEMSPIDDKRSCARELLGISDVHPNAANCKRTLKFYRFAADLRAIY